MDISEISRLGQLIQQRAKPTDYIDDAFSRIASEALADARLEGDLDLAEITAHALEVPPTRLHSIPSADLELPLYVSAHFVIELHVWRDGNALVREPDWRGAYALLFGSGIGTSYQFEETRRINANLRTGSLVARSCELLTAGHVRRVNAGSGMAVDSFFPLESPTGALVVRTLELPECPSRLTHFRPSLALSEAGAVDDRLVKDALKATEVAARLGDEELLMRVMHASLRALDRFRGSYVALFTPLPGSEWRNRYLDEVPPLLEDLEEDLRRALEWCWSIDDTRGAREHVDDPELRFAITAHCGAPDAHALRALIHERYPGVDPFELVVGRVSALIDDGQLSVAWDPETREDALLRAFLRGETVEDAMRSRVREQGSRDKEAASEAFDLMADDAVLRAVRPVATRLASVPGGCAS
jgi:hypothetical protein